MSATIAKALHQVMSQVGYVQKTGKNAFHGYKYAGEADLLEKLRPALLDAGLILIPSVEHVSPIDEHGNTTVRVAYTIVHKDGDVWPDKVYAVGCGGDRSKGGSVGDKGVYKALTGCNKYLLFKLFQIETGDDPESDSPAERLPSSRPPVTDRIAHSPDTPPATAPEADNEATFGRLMQDAKDVAVWDLSTWSLRQDITKLRQTLSDEQRHQLKAVINERILAAKSKVV